MLLGVIFLLELWSCVFCVSFIDLCCFSCIVVMFLLLVVLWGFKVRSGCGVLLSGGCCFFG